MSRILNNAQFCAVERETFDKVKDDNLMTRFLSHKNTKTMNLLDICSVFKTGPDCPVQPVGPGAGSFAVWYSELNRPVVKPDGFGVNHFNWVEPVLYLLGWFSMVL